MDMLIRIWIGITDRLFKKCSAVCMHECYERVSRRVRGCCVCVSEWCVYLYELLEECEDVRARGHRRGGEVRPRHAGRAEGTPVPPKQHPHHRVPQHKQLGTSHDSPSSSSSSFFFLLSLPPPSLRPPLSLHSLHSHPFSSSFSSPFPYLFVYF